MNKSRLAVFGLGTIILVWPLTAYANSSWSWVADRTPLSLFPFAIVFTLLIEILAVIQFGKVEKRVKAAIVVILANLMSFLVPQLFEIWELPEPTIIEAVNAGLYYFVTLGYLFITLLFELPVVFLSLQRNTRFKKRLLLSIIISNTITTAAVVISERLLCSLAMY